MDSGWRDESGCLTQIAIESIVAGDDAPEGVMAHLETCERCQGRVAGGDAGTALAEEIRGVNAGVTLEDVNAPAGYEIRRELHRGAQGVVFEAYHAATKRTVALKMLLAGTLATSRQRARFEREVELAASLNHPGVVAIYDSGLVGSQPFVAMELVDGRTIDAWAAGHRGTPTEDSRRLAELFVGVCDAVAAAHRRGVIHRDLKPSNILVDSEGRPRIVDFGIARQADSTAATLTQAEAFVGTLGYAAPEQVTGGQADTRTDVYSLGLVLYELLTERPAQATETSFAEALRSITERTPTAPVRARPGVDAELSAIVMKAIEKEPGRRYASAEAFGADLGRLLEGRPVEARPASVWYVGRKFVGRHPRALVAAVVVVVALMGLGMWGLNEADFGGKQVSLIEESLFQLNVNEASGADVREVLRRVSDLVDKELKRYPLKQADYNMRLGQAMLSRDMYAEALQRFELALGQRREQLGSSDVRVAESLLAVGDAFWWMDEYENADGPIREALAQFVRIDGEESTRVADARRRLGSILNRMGRRSEASSTLAESLGVYESLGLGSSIGAANVHNSIAVNCLGSGDLTGALDHANRALAILEVADGEHTLERAGLLGVIGDVNLQSHEYAAAIDAFEESVELKRAWRGSDDADVAVSLVNLAQAKQYLAGEVKTADDYQLLREAETMLNEAVAAFRLAGSSGPHRELANALSLLGEVQRRRGNLFGARKSLTESLDLWRELGMDPSIGIGLTEARLARALQQLGDTEGAIGAWRAGIDDLSRSQGPEHPETRVAREQLAILLESAGQLGEAARIRAELDRPPD